MVEGHLKPKKNIAGSDSKLNCKTEQKKFSCYLEFSCFLKFSSLPVRKEENVLGR